MLQTVLHLSLFFGPPPTCGELENTEEVRTQTFEAIEATCQAVNAKPLTCGLLAAVTWRESRGFPYSIHTKGKNEKGVGAHGIGSFWAWKLRKAGFEIDLCDPRQSSLAVLWIWQTFAKRGAQTVLHLQRGYSGHPFSDEKHPKRDAKWCALVAKWAPEADCETGIENALGDPIRPEDIEAVVASVPYDY